jgi:FAD/FMN-containing dehydrogenase
VSPQKLCKQKGLRNKGDLVHQINDVSLLNETEITCIIQPVSIKEVSEIVSSLHQWNKNLDTDKRMSLSIAGTRHSQGGHIANKHGITLDLSKLNQVDKPTQFGTYWEVKVQAGALWSQVHDVIKNNEEISLANKVQQSSTPFSVGGSLSVNAHGRNFHYGSIIHSVRAITLIVPNGDIIYASRKKNNELFRLAIGGYGLFGIIAEVHLELLKIIF